MSQSTIVGCLLDVSGSMQETLEAERGEAGAVECLRAVIRAAVQLARAEYKHDPDALLDVRLRSTDGDPVPLASQLKNDGIFVATIFLTNKSSEAQKELYDRPKDSWDGGQRALFEMTTHPSSGECALYAAVCSSDALEEFCSVLLSARFGSADVMLDILERCDHDRFINDKHVSIRRNPSDQGDEGVCYAHATAAEIHMALLRIVDREGGYPTIEAIRDRILAVYPARLGGQPTARVLEEAAKWYRPLRFREVDEDGSRQAVLRRLPVLTTFRLTKAG
ncbi:hypothetical protein B0H63DRAFT_558144 [Podospora didyma]|uniref:Uncharacterized protein n=1 Tax=Podospora didyma TaxID=330526 RepID=A0AAE0U0J5_9PEZI|nr:hypothetical protein B0H63DRAFT_558144 [Podospora didyma]